MARGINKVILIGNVGNDPDVRYAPSGSAITSLSLATSETWKDKQNGESQERTEWHRIVFFNRIAEIAGEYLKKGSKVYIEGSLRTRKWQDKAGVEHYTTEIIGADMQLLDGKADTNELSYQENKTATRSNIANDQSQSSTNESLRFVDEVPF